MKGILIVAFLSSICVSLECQIFYSCISTVKNNDLLLHYDSLSNTIPPEEIQLAETEFQKIIDSELMIVSSNDSIVIEDENNNTYTFYPRIAILPTGYIIEGSSYTVECRVLVDKEGDRRIWSGNTYSINKSNFQDVKVHDLDCYVRMVNARNRELSRSRIDYFLNSSVGSRTVNSRRSNTNLSSRGTTTRRYFRGPRGGCYYINSNGNKTYVDRSYCN